MENETNPYDNAPAQSGPYDVAPAAPIQDINQSSYASEAGLAQGVQSFGVMTAVESSGPDQQANQEAAARFAQRAHAAIANGIPPSQMMADPNLSAAAQAEIYEATANAAGTSADAIEQAARDAAARDMAAIQSAVFGGAALATVAGTSSPAQAEQDAAQFTLAGGTATKYVLNDDERYLASTTQVIADMGMRGGFTPDNTPAQGIQRGISQGRS